MKLEENCNDLKNMNYFIKMTGLGGHVSKKNSLLNSQAIQTDFKNSRCLTLNFCDICNICMSLRGSSE